MRVNAAAGMLSTSECVVRVFSFGV